MPGSSTPARASRAICFRAGSAWSTDGRGALCHALNPVRARLAARAEDSPHSSVRAHIAGRDNGLVSFRPLLARFRPPHSSDTPFAFAAAATNFIVCPNASFSGAAVAGSAISAKRAAMVSGVRSLSSR